MLRAKVLERNSAKSLEKELNDFLQTIYWEKIVDIKYSASMGELELYSVLVLYKE